MKALVVLITMIFNIQTNAAASWSFLHPSSIEVTSAIEIPDCGFPCGYRTMVPSRPN